MKVFAYGLMKYEGFVWNINVFAYGLMEYEGFASSIAKVCINELCALMHCLILIIK